MLVESDIRIPQKKIEIQCEQYTMAEERVRVFMWYNKMNSMSRRKKSSS